MHGRIKKNTQPSRYDTLCQMTEKHQTSTDAHLKIQNALQFFVANTECTQILQNVLQFFVVNTKCTPIIQNILRFFVQST